VRFSTSYLERVLGTSHVCDTDAGTDEESDDCEPESPSDDGIDETEKDTGGESGFEFDSDVPGFACPC